MLHGWYRGSVWRKLIGDAWSVMTVVGSNECVNDRDLRPMTIATTDEGIACSKEGVFIYHVQHCPYRE